MAELLNSRRLQPEGRAHVEAQLSEDGLRPALPTEAGWFTLVEFGGDAAKIWATDDAIPDLDGVAEVSDLFDHASL